MIMNHFSKTSEVQKYCYAFNRQSTPKTNIPVPITIFKKKILIEIYKIARNPVL